MDAETKKRTWDQVVPLLRQFRELDGAPRSQTHRSTLGCTIATMMMPLLVTESAASVKPPVLPPLMPVPANWKRAKIGKTKWNGLCRRCKEDGREGQIVSHSPTGRPSTWQHLLCPADEQAIPRLF